MQFKLAGLYHSEQEGKWRFQLFLQWIHVNVFESDLESRDKSVSPTIPGRSHKGSVLFGVGSIAAALVIKTQRSDSKQKKTSGWIDSDMLHKQTLMHKDLGSKSASMKENFTESV